MTSDKSIDPYKYKTKPGKDLITAETTVSDQFWASSEVMNIKKFIMKLGELNCDLRKAIELNSNTHRTKPRLKI